MRQRVGKLELITKRIGKLILPRAGRIGFFQPELIGFLRRNRKGRKQGDRPGSCAESENAANKATAIINILFITIPPIFYLVSPKLQFP